MRRISGLALWLLLPAFIACSEASETSLVQGPDQIDDSSSPPASAEIYDGTSEDEGANPYFYFRAPIAAKTPQFSGIADNTQEPTVTVCPIGEWNFAEERCNEGQETAEYTLYSPDKDPIQVDVRDEKYYTIWRTQDYPTTDGTTYRIAVYISQKLLGFADVFVFDGKLYVGDPADPTTARQVTGNSDGSLNITFRIEEGALEAEYCDITNLEDCDVALFTYETGGCLRVYENPGDTGEQLGSLACVPSHAANLGGEPVMGTYAVILTLEDQGNFQGGILGTDQQIPYFPDLYTDPPGITFDPNSDGVNVTICQIPLDDGTAPGYVPEEFHPYLRPFIVYANGTTVLPEDFYYGVAECEGFDPHAHMASLDTEPGGFLALLARGAAKVGRFLLPEPLVARRLHGGLNTTVYDTRGDKGDTDSGEGAPAFATALEPEIAEFGAVLDVNPDNSTAIVPATGVVGDTTAITILALDPRGAPFPFEVPVAVSVLSGSETVIGKVSYEGSGSYTGKYVPAAGGTDIITITVDGYEIPGSPFESEISALSGDLVVDLDITGSAPENGLPVYLYQDDASLYPDETTPPFRSGTTDADGRVTFTDVEFGDYRIHFPNRDFDMDFEEMTRSITLSSTSQEEEFSAATLSMPESAQIWRIREGGNGNAYKYIVDGRSFGASLNQIAAMAPLHGVQPHIVDIFTPDENDFVKGIFLTDLNLCPGETNTKQCKFTSWIGLTDEVLEGEFRWVTTGELATWFNWPDGNTAADQPLDRKGNQDQVEMGVEGTWSIINGASSTNDGYFVEWDVSQPETPPFP